MEKTPKPAKKEPLIQLKNVNVNHYEFTPTVSAFVKIGFGLTAGMFGAFSWLYLLWKAVEFIINLVTNLF